MLNSNLLPPFGHFDPIIRGAVDRRISYIPDNKHEYLRPLSPPSNGAPTSNMGDDSQTAYCGSPHTLH